ncbi:E3 ubiquitin-protein ligase RNF123 isoform X1 [Leptonychotes weddellii]|uniref:RING-type E3 ubiquitin transferase n=1 Tax=Leptonychotes weddellii TaxID=9713 RepID=A0A2U3YLI9_LEPWE|nr:E3 ubiquitin-protein ligase RNF123 isoform X1 [Leptonychotes weddellii]
MLAHLTSASAQAAAASLVSGAAASGCAPPTYVLAQLCTLHRLLVSLSGHPAPAHPALCSLQPTSEEDLCPICYAHPISAVFQPCGHKSCKACINQHLMNNKDCFFCKATIVSVEDWEKAASASTTTSSAA